jgi:hypothetical protein
VKNIIISILLLLTVLSCNQQKSSVTVPADVLSPDSMVQVLSDIHLAEAEATLHPYSDSLGIINLPAYYKYIFNNHKLDTAMFNRSMNFYLSNPELLNTVYNGILDELSKRHARYQQKDQ